MKQNERPRMSDKFMTKEDLKLQQAFNKEMGIIDEMNQPITDDNIPADIPEELIVVDNIPYISSLTVATKFGKRHNHLMRDVRDSYEEIIQMKQSEDWHDFGQSSYKPLPSTYKNTQNKEQPCYLIPHKLFDYLVLGYTGKDAKKYRFYYIEKFYLMEDTINKMKLALNENVNVEEAKAGLMEILSNYDRKIEAYEKKLADVNIFHKKEVNMYGQTIKDLNEKLKGFESVQNLIDYVGQGAFTVSGLSNKAKDNILMMADAIKQTGYFPGKYKNSWRNNF